jgi:methylenetetrahydrofolate dehydrogenase (NADP+)/methenyltetrahydrofolate cyclohydrolase
MVAQLIDGKAEAKKLRAPIADRVATFVDQHGRPPGLDVVLVGEDPASVVYTRMKEKAAAKAGIRGTLHKLPEDISQAALLEKVAGLNARDDVDGILVQLPLPDHIDPDAVIDTIDVAKDVDGFHPQSLGLLMSGRPGLVACTPKGCMQLIATTGQPLEGANAVVVGRSKIVGKPMAQLLLAENATVTTAHSRTKDLAGLCRTADVLVVAVGRQHLVKGDWIKEGAVVIDVGTNRGEDGKLHGDVDFESAKERAGYITPVPGGVGPMTIANLLDNTLAAATARLGA